MINMEALISPLPEDILKAKWCGDFDRANRLIDMYIKNPKVANCVKARLEVEKEIIKRLPVEYCYSKDEAFSVIKNDIKDFAEEEFEKLIDSSAIDWIYIKGELTASRRFYETLLKVNTDLAIRAGVSDGGETPERKLLNINAEEMSANGSARWHIRLKTSLKIGDHAFKKDEKALVHLPGPKDAINNANINIISYSPAFGIVGDLDEDQRTISFVGKFQENVPFTVEYEYDSVVNYNKLVSGVADEIQPSFNTNEEYSHIVFSPFIKTLCNELKGELTDPVDIARSFYDYCTKNLSYSYMREYFTITDIPEYAATGLKGDCGVQALLFITLCRCAGIPAKWQSGLFVTPYSCGCHDWAQFYVEPYGWVFADPSFGGSAYRSGNMLRHEHYFGNLDPFRMVANSEYQRDLKPNKSYVRVDPYDNQTGEVEYESGGLTRNDYETTWDILECKKMEE